MAIIDPVTKKPIFSSKDAFEQEYNTKHFEVIKLHASAILQDGVHSANDLRLKIVKLYYSKLREHEVEITNNPRESIKYLLACLEVYHVCLQHIFETITTHKAMEKINDDTESESETESETEADDTTKNTM